mmetsp:Transcript_27828/g.78693  ORF Transcript_27828/g.78693 Transcript_27828/m.78693 type:complete len:435 (+) Transcript_27828:595-1899(+)
MPELEAVAADRRLSAMTTETVAPEKVAEPSRAVLASFCLERMSSWWRCWLVAPHTMATFPLVAVMIHSPSPLMAMLATSSEASSVDNTPLRSPAMASHTLTRPPARVAATSPSRLSTSPSTVSSCSSCATIPARALLRARVTAQSSTVPLPGAHVANAVSPAARRGAPAGAPGPCCPKGVGVRAAVEAESQSSCDSWRHSPVEVSHRRRQASAPMPTASGCSPARPPETRARAVAEGANGRRGWKDGWLLPRRPHTKPVPSVAQLATTLLPSLVQTVRTGPRCPYSCLSRLLRSHSLAVLSQEAVTARLPSAVMAIPVILSPWPSRVCMQVPFPRSHTCATRSLLPETLTSLVPSGLTEIFPLEFCPVRTCLHCPISMSHTLVEPSCEAVTTVFSLALMATACTRSSCPSRRQRPSPLPSSHTQAVVSHEVVTT